MKKRLLEPGLLYVVLDRKTVKEANRNIFLLADKLAYYGADLFQLRAKNITDMELSGLAANLSRIIHKRRRWFIVNDRVDIAYISGADGVHLGAQDIHVNKARTILGRNAIVGKTAHSLSEVKRFKKERVDYLSLGPVFNTAVKPELKPLFFKELRSMVKHSTKPTFAIGGINLHNLRYLFDVGIRNVAVGRGVVLPEGVKRTVFTYKECLKKVS